MRLGAHMSIAGGVKRAILRGHSIGCETIQMFVTSPNRWKSKALTQADIDGFLAARTETGIWPIVAHDTYLINLGSPDEELWTKSIDAFHDELKRCEQLELPYLVMHPGSHMGAGDEAGLRRVADALDILRERTVGFHVKVLLETTAGQGTNLGHRFEHLAQIMDWVRDASWLGVCLDTCHVFAAGYELRTREGYEETIQQFDRVLGLHLLKCIHLNDSKGCLGCHLDRHEHIGKGELGLEPFRFLLNDPRFNHLPMILETPKGTDEQGRDWDELNAAVLRGLWAAR